VVIFQNGLLQQGLALIGIEGGAGAAAFFPPFLRGNMKGEFLPLLNSTLHGFPPIPNFAQLKVLRRISV